MIASNEAFLYIAMGNERDIGMTKLLEKAIAATEKLSDAEQDTIAAMILEELADEKRWEQSFARSQKQLSILAKEALSEHKAGRTKPLELLIA